MAEVSVKIDLILKALLILCDNLKMKFAVVLYAIAQVGVSAILLWE